jgi:hypothetical protein
MKLHAAFALGSAASPFGRPPSGSVTGTTSATSKPMVLPADSVRPPEGEAPPFRRANSRAGPAIMLDSSEGGAMVMKQRGRKGKAGTKGACSSPQRGDRRTRGARSKQKATTKTPRAQSPSSVLRRAGTPPLA